MAESLARPAAAATPSRPRRRRTRRAVEVGARLVLPLVTAAFAAFPVLYMISAAVNPSNTLVGTSLLPRDASLANFQGLFEDAAHPFVTWMWNSLKISGLTAAIVGGLSAAAAYSFARLRWRGRIMTLRTLVFVQLFPNVLAIVALYLLLLQVGRVVPAIGLGTHEGLILIYSAGGLGFNVWLMKGYFDSIPRELDESARLDGASDLQIFRHLILPLGRPIITVVTLVTFIGTYSDFLLPRVMLQRVEDYTLAVGLSLSIRGNYSTEWGNFAAGALIGAIPILLIFLVLQRELVGGLTRGAVK